MHDGDTGPDGPEQSRTQSPTRSRSLWGRVAGDGSHIGFWTLPVFIATALGGAVIAGSIANVYYAQQVALLEEETRAARVAAEVAASDIDAAREDALDAIDEQLSAVRAALDVARPLGDPAAEGVVAIVAELTPAPAPTPTSAATSPPAGDASANGSADPFAANPATDPSDEPTEPEPTTAPNPIDEATPPPVVGATTRVGVGFVVAVDGSEVFVATSYGVVADPRSPTGVAPAISIATPNGTVRGIVHAWDKGRHLAIVRASVGPLPILPWRPVAVPILAGDVAVLAGVTPSLDGVQLPGRVGAVTSMSIITDLPMDPSFDGAPVLDAVGRVIGLQSSTAAPFGAGSSAVIPAGQLCIELVSGCSLLEVEHEDDAARRNNE